MAPSPCARAGGQCESDQHNGAAGGFRRGLEAVVLPGTAEPVYYDFEAVR